MSVPLALTLTAAAVLLTAGSQSVRVDQPHNVVLFVPDGLRTLIVDPEVAPTLASLRDHGVNFRNPHSLFPTVTTPNASAMATGHYLGDTGNFSNTIFSNFPVRSAGQSTTPFLENDAVLGEIDAHFGGNYLHEATIASLARKAGFSTALIGKIGPTLIFDHTDLVGTPTVVIDDSTGTPGGISLSGEMKAAMEAAGLPLTAPGRGQNGEAGTATLPGTRVPNRLQQDYFVNVAKVVLPLFKARRRPFFLMFWSRDPDGSQHNQGDSPNELTPGINGPTSLAAIRNADDSLARLQSTLTELGLAAVTNIIVSSDHGFSTISKQSQTSRSARERFDGVPGGFLPPGFLALDLAIELGLPVFDPDAENLKMEPPYLAKRSNGLIGVNPAAPDIVVAANGASDLIYVPRRNRALVAKIIDVLLAQDYVSGIFVDSTIGTFAGTLPLKTANLEGAAVTPRPAIVVSFRSFSTGCRQPVLCAAEVADTALQQGQGHHGSFSRADTMNFMAAAGPDFKEGFIDEAPVSNADVGLTIAHIMKLSVSSRGRLTGRVLTEGLRGGRMPAYVSGVIRSAPAIGGLRTVLRYQKVGRTTYFDAAGFPGRTIGLEVD